MSLAKIAMAQIMYQALNTSHGAIIRYVGDPMQVRNLFYQTQRTQGDLDDLSLYMSPDEENEFWIVKRSTADATN